MRHTKSDTRPAILDRVEALGYAVFESGTLNLNIVGERHQVNPNAFDDTLHVVFRANGEWHHYEYPCTTDPGTYWLKEPMNVLGTAILKPGQYRGGLRLGKHKGRYRALVQARPMDVYRDNNMDAVLDFGKVYTGMFGINIHRATKYGTSTVVDRWSAGCQVFADNLDFDHFIDLCESAADTWGPFFTYTLLEA